MATQLTMDPQVMYMGAVVGFIGAITYGIKKCSDNGVAFRSNCCKGMAEVEIDTNKELDPDFFKDRSGSQGQADAPPPSAKI